LRGSALCRPSTGTRVREFDTSRKPHDATVEGRQVPPELFKVDKPVDRPQQVVGRDMSFERELIEQRSLFDLPMAHHDLQSCQLDRLNHCYLCVATAAFFNRIGQNPTFGVPTGKGICIQNCGIARSA
jgi:hypothetical protein